MTFVRKVKKQFEDFVIKCFGSSKEVADVLNLAAQCDSYVETLSCKADSLHLRVKRHYEDSLKVLYSGFVKPLILKERLGVVDLVADVTDEDFYGKVQGFYLHPWTGEAGVKAHFKFLVVSILFRNKIIPFYVAVLRIGCDIAQLLGEAVTYFSHLKVRTILLDRGFYSGNVIRVLDPKVKYLIFAPKKGLYKCMLEGTHKSVVVEHEIKINRDFTKHKVPTDLVLAKNVLEYDWVFATNLYLEDIKRYVHIYRARWNIETMFRVQDEARIKSKSKKAVIRLFYFILSLLIVLLWNLHAKQRTTFKKFIITLMQKSSEVGIRTTS